MFGVRIITCCVVQVMHSSWTVLREFLQPETTIPMLTQASRYITSQTQQALVVMQGEHTTKLMSLKVIQILSVCLECYRDLVCNLCWIL